MGLASESYLRISNLRECYRVVSLRKPYVLSMLKAQEYDVSRIRAVAGGQAVLWHKVGLSQNTKPSSPAAALKDGRGQWPEMTAVRVPCRDSELRWKVPKR